MKKLIFSLPIGSKEIRFEVDEYKGKQRFNARQYYFDALSGIMRPTKFGVVIPIEELRLLYESIGQYFNEKS